MMYQNQGKCSKMYAIVVLIVAAVLSLLLFTLPIEQIDHVVIVIKFFESMLPILAVGVLFKYLWSSKKGCCYCGNTCQTNTANSCNTTTTTVPPIHS